MCKASIDHPDAPDGGVGDDLNIDGNSFGMGTAHRQTPTRGRAKKGDRGRKARLQANSCLVCLHTGAELTMTNVLPQVAKALNLDLGEPVKLTFIETPGSHIQIIHDLVVVQGRPDLGQFPFAVFKDCTATLTKAPARGEITPEQAIGEAAQVVPVIGGESSMDMLRRIAVETSARHTPPPATPSRTTVQDHVAA